MEGDAPDCTPDNTASGFTTYYSQSHRPLHPNIFLRVLVRMLSLVLHFGNSSL